MKKISILCFCLFFLFITISPSHAVNIRKIKVTSSMLKASSIYNGYTPLKAFDGDFRKNSGWCAAGGIRKAWLIIDFKIEMEIDSLRLQPDRFNAKDKSSSYLTAFSVDIWKNNSWSPISNLISTPLETWFNVPIKKKTQKLRILCETTGNSPQVKEIEIFEVVPTINKPTVITPKTSRPEVKGQSINRNQAPRFTL
ncbi:MAG: discoidin domain-containing protein [Candidatus Ozemobacteraceae bacterium]